MAQVTFCPRCNLELFVPESLKEAGGANCPECGSFIELDTTSVRELQSLSPSTVDYDPPQKAAATVSDFPSLATWSGELGNEVPIEINEAEKLIASTNAADDDILPTSDSVDEAAQRIDAWFKSAKTLADLPVNSLDEPSVPEPYVNRAAETTSIDSETDFSSINDENANDVTADLGATTLSGLETESEFELEPTLDSADDSATWDDSQHMDRLLAGVENQPAAEFTPFLATSSHAEEVTNDSHAETEWSQNALPDDLKVGLGTPPKKRSLVRMLSMTVISGAAGLAIGYFVLLWLRGPAIDFLNVAHYIPKSILPASFSAAPARTGMASTPAPMAPAAPEPENVATVPANDEPAAETPKDSGAVQASYDEPVEPKNETVATDESPATALEQTAAVTEANTDATATTASTDPVSLPVENAAAEPAALNTQPGAPLAEIAPIAELPKITGAPAFAPADLAAAMKAATDAQPALVKGNLTDGKEVARTKGMSYSTLADLAQKMTFVDTSAASAEIVDTHQKAEELFRQTLADEHTRSEVAQITPMWIAAPKRQHGGVFFAGQLSAQKPEGSVVESEVDLGTGKSLTVIMPPALAQGVGDKPGPMAMVGWIVDHPAQQVDGYKGAATQAVFVSRLIPLQ